ncbi:3-carboxy-cis,cis-muconate cycloisomerase [Klebsiella michiganensis]|uniref:3-carboxy-cis,cis-muconate cycloisomerase n=1 Tax=Klebsiella michiganensis TaxID=1134687 RepID=A0A7H4MY52_9ENTR|nr:3-carboxy-cis,cis-muconate cycloisomerase [Klebsiella michiganensis]
MSLLTPMMRTSPLTAWFSDAQRVQGCWILKPRWLALRSNAASCRRRRLIPLLRVAGTKTSTSPRWGRPPPAPGSGDPAGQQLTARVKQRDDAAARYVHWGATSQDAIDTGFILQLRGALAETDSCCSNCSTR